MSQDREAPYEHFLRMFVLVFGAAFGLWALLASFSQVPDLDSVGFGGGIVLAFAGLAWARAQHPRVTHALVQRHGGFWLFLLGVILFPYYLIATRRGRSARQGLSVGAAYLSSTLAWVGGGTAANYVVIPPRFLETRPGEWTRVTAETGARIARGDFASLKRFLELEIAAGRRVPGSFDELYARYWIVLPNARTLTDPFTGHGYYIDFADTSVVFWSTGPDRTINTDDDIWDEWRASLVAHVPPN